MTLRRSAALALTLVALGCPKAPPYDPFRVSRDEVERAVKSVALVGQVTVPVADPGKVLDSFETLITAKLVALGLTVVPRATTKALWDDAAKRIGGLYDPNTGKVDDAKRTAVREHFRRELAASHHADTLLFFVVGPAKATFDGGQAAWHGVKEGISAGGFWNAVDVANRGGQVTACSLFVTLEDLSGRALYQNAGGVELLYKIQGGQFVEVPREEVLVRPANHAQAVDIAFRALLAPPGAPPSTATATVQQ